LQVIINIIHRSVINFSIRIKNTYESLKTFEKMSIVQKSSPFPFDNYVKYHHWLFAKSV